MRWTFALEARVQSYCIVVRDIQRFEGFEGQLTFEKTVCALELTGRVKGIGTQYAIDGANVIAFGLQLRLCGLAQ